MIKFMAATLAVALASTAAYAGMDGISVSQDKRMVIATKPSGKYIAPTFRPKKAPPAIFSNLGVLYPNGEYFCCYGSTISGPTSALGITQYVAVAFTPTTSTSVTEVDAGVGYIEGTNEIDLVLYADDNGVPGTVLKSWKATGLPTFGGCCAVATGTDKKGVPVTAGTQYWVGVVADKDATDVFAAWNFNSTDMIDAVTTAYYNGTSWTAYGALPATDIAIYGK
jgi:hypothetical protein